MKPQLTTIGLALLFLLVSEAFCKLESSNEDEKILRFKPQIKALSKVFERHPGTKTDSVKTQNKDILQCPWWSTFILTIIQYFFQQRWYRNGNQFGVLYMANVDNLNEFPTTFQPERDGHPIIDREADISPAQTSDYGNYLACRPYKPTQRSRAIHSEDTLLRNIDTLWNAYYNRNRRLPNFVLVYSWFMPCPECTNIIINHLTEARYRNVQYRVVAYSNEGSQIPYLTPEANNQSRRALEENGLFVHKEECERPDFDMSSAEHGIEAANQMCNFVDTFQGCLMYNILENQVDACCSCTAEGKFPMHAAMINDLAKTCANKSMTECSNAWIASWMNAKHSGASKCLMTHNVTDKLLGVIEQCNGRILSQPLDLKHPLVYQGYLTKFSDLQRHQKPDYTSYCKDMRTGNILCSAYRQDSYTAGNTLCRSGNRCGYNGQKYSWCYVDFSNNWDYCCVGSCRKEHTILPPARDYLACDTGGGYWQYCGDAGDVDIDGNHCLTEYPCGMHQEDGKERYYWCYTDVRRNWGYCCQPGDTCSNKEKSYKWCWTGYLLQHDYQHCRMIEKACP